AKAKPYRFGQQISTEEFDITIHKNRDSLKNDGRYTLKLHQLDQYAEWYSSQISVAPVNKNASVLKISLTDPVKEKAKDIINMLIDVYNQDAIDDKNLMASNTVNFINTRLRELVAELSGVEYEVSS